MRLPQLALTVAAALLLAGCLASQDSNDAADSGLEGEADPCDAVLVVGSAEGKCGDGLQEARCAQAAANPDVELLWSLELEQRYEDDEGNLRQYPEDQQRFRRDCVLDYLESFGVEAPSGSEHGIDSVWVDAAYSPLAPAIALNVVDEVNVYCEGDHPFCDCSGLDLEGCAAHAFCQEIHASYLDPEAGCWRSSETVGCTRGEVCGAAMTPGCSPDDECYLFSSTCLPDQPGWEEASPYGEASCCGGQWGWLDLPECE